MASRRCCPTAWRLCGPTPARHPTGRPPPSDRLTGRFGAVLLFVLGAVIAQQVAFGGYLDYVKPAQGPWLLAGGLVSSVIGLWYGVRRLAT